MQSDQAQSDRSDEGSRGLSAIKAFWRFLTGRRKYWPPAPTLDDLVDLRSKAKHDCMRLSDHYLVLFQRFEKSEGVVQRQYWGIHQRLALVLTELPRNIIKRWLHRPPVMHLHRSSIRFDLPSGFHAALNEGDMLAVRANWSLGDLSRHTVLDRIFEAEAFLLRMVDRAGEPLPATDLRVALKHYLDQLFRIQIELNTAAVRRAQYSYTFGAIAGLFLFGVAAAICVPVARSFGHSVHDHNVALAFGCAVAGALGAAASASWKASSGDLRVDPAAGIGALPRIAMQRPGIGAIFGLAVYFALQSGFIQIGPPAKNFYFYAFFGFIAGFSERLVPGLIRRAETQVAPHSSSDPVEPPPNSDDGNTSDSPSN